MPKRNANEQTPKEKDTERLQKQAIQKMDNDKADGRSRRKKKITFERAKQVFEQIKREKEQKREQAQVERKQREKSLAVYKKNKKKMNQAIKKTNRKGQPNLGAQMEVILQKLNRKIEQNEL